MNTASVFTNPIVNFFFYLIFSLSVFATHTLPTVLLHSGFFLFLLYLHNGILKIVFKRIYPFFLFLPLLVGIYFLVSLLISNAALLTIFKELGFITFRLIVVVIIMTVYLERASADSFLTAWRSLWVTLKKPWKIVENWFLFLEMTLRFFPTFQREWEAVQQTRKSLHLVQPRNRLLRVKQLVEDLTAFLIFRLRRSEETALAMELRGYGNRIPRGVTNPIPFRILHVIQIFMLLGLFLGIQYLA